MKSPHMIPQQLIKPGLIGAYVLIMLATPLLAITAYAQNNITGGVLGPGSATAGAGPGAGSQQNGRPGPRRPSALPGTRTEKNEPAPASRIASDMAPNEALFDGINRGDMVYVRDAISRGADLNSRNILGLTPVDLSVDLGRTDITFLLLSMRGSGGNGPPTGTGQSVKSLLQAAAKAELKPAKAARAARDVAPAPPSKPKLFANDGGAPIPNAGFLGFGNQR